MSIISEEEAIASVAVRGHCDELDTWKHSALVIGSWDIESGVQDALGIRHDQYIHLHITQLAMPSRGHRFVFTSFGKAGHQKERIYQLDLRFSNRKSAGWHERSHEHLGSMRLEEDPEWRNWEFGQALAHFCQRSNIYLIPNPPNPLLATKEKGHAHRDY